MRKWIYIGLILLGSVPCFSQADPGGQDGASPASNQGQMAMPPPVSGAAYPTAVGGEARSNFLRGGMAFNTSYISNLYPGSSVPPASETTYSILPTISFDQTTPRQHRAFSYSPGFTFYQPDSTLNEMDQRVEVQYQIRLTPHSSISATDTFMKSASAFSESAVSGSLPNTTAGVAAPFTALMTNAVQGQYSLQLSPGAMVGVTGQEMLLHYPNPGQAAGLYNSDEYGGSVFYNHRISASQYAGATYRYSWFNSTPVQTQGTATLQSVGQTHAFFGFYTIYLTHSFSISGNGGIQRFEISETSSPKTVGWAPMVMASFGFQVLRTSISANYSRQVSGGGGLIGASTSTAAGITARRELSRTWTAGVTANYSANKSVSALLLDTQHGNSILGSATLDHTFNDQLSIEFGYERINQSYNQIAAIAGNPNSDRFTVLMRWQFMRPLGR